MKRRDELTELQQSAALGKCRESILERIGENAVRFNDKLNHDDLQDRIDAAQAKMERLRTPWFIGEAIMETCAEEINGMAQCDAEDALYAEHGENIIRGILS